MADLDRDGYDDLLLKGRWHFGGPKGLGSRLPLDDVYEGGGGSPRGALRGARKQERTVRTRVQATSVAPSAPSVPARGSRRSR